MRIISGELRGRTLRAPKGDGTRPTTDRVREALMSMVASARGGFEGAVVLDAFAGSGALGLEALSRGASFAVFCEVNHEAQKVISSNIANCGVGSRVSLRRLDAFKSVPAAPNPYDLVFLDPPYAYNPHEVLGLVQLAFQRNLLENKVLIIYEHAVSSNDLVDKAIKDCHLVLLRRKKYGETAVDLLGRGDTL